MPDIMVRFLALLLLPTLLAGCVSQREGGLPPQVTLKNVGHEHQALNNCGPVNAMIVLNYHGHGLTQAQAARALKDSPQDVEVSTREVADYLETFGLKTLIRYGGDLNVIRSLLVQELPVIVQQRLEPGDDTAHFRTVYAYSPDGLVASDPLRGADLRLSNDTFIDLWNYYNGEYLVVYPPEREADVQAALGRDWEEQTNWQQLLKKSRTQTRENPDDAFAWWGQGAAQLALGQEEKAAQAFDRAVEAGVPLQYYWYRQEAFEAWNQTSQHQKTLSLTEKVLAQQPGIKEVEFYREAALRLAAS